MCYDVTYGYKPFRTTTKIKIEPGEIGQEEQEGLNRKRLNNHEQMNRLKEIK
jgi:hypothetical protein